MLFDLSRYLEPPSLEGDGKRAARAVLQRMQREGFDPKGAYEQVKKVHEAANWPVPAYEEIAP